MQLRRPRYGVTVGLVLLLSPALQAAHQVRTQNFLVEAPTQELAQRFGQAAEHFRKQKAIEWIGQEMPPWPRPCPLYVKPKPGGPGGATKFNYDFRGGYEVLSMEIEGDIERMQNSVLPHEVTHTVFAHYFRYPVPRWADEGGSVLSEDDRERYTHDQLCRQKLNAHTAIPLRRLFTVKEYGEVGDVMVIYAQGYSISQYLVDQRGRQAFLGFVRMGLNNQWDAAAQQYYNFQSIEMMEEAWKKNLRETKGMWGMARNNANSNQPAGALTSRPLVRETAPPAQPRLDPAGPVARGQSDDDARRGATMAGRPAYLPDVPGQSPTSANLPPLKVPAPPQAAAPTLPPVRLGVPQFGAAPSAPPAAGVDTAVGRGN